MDERIPVEQRTVSYNAPDTFVPTTGLSVKVSDIEAIVRRVVAEVDRSGGDFFRCKMCGGRKERETDHCGCGQTRWHVDFSGDPPRDVSAVPDDRADPAVVTDNEVYRLEIKGTAGVVESRDSDGRVTIVITPRPSTGEAREAVVDKAYDDFDAGYLRGWKDAEPEAAEVLGGKIVIEILPRSKGGKA